MICNNCNNEIYNAPHKEYDSYEYWGTTLSEYEYVLECEHCHTQYELDTGDIYEAYDED